MMLATLLAQATAPVGNAADSPPSTDLLLLLRMLAILAGLLIVSVILLKVGLPWLMRRRTGGKADLIEVVEAHRLEPRKIVYLLRVGAQYYLVGSCDGRLTTLAGEPLDNETIAEALADRARRQPGLEQQPSQTGSSDDAARPSP